jgi:NAD(P)-dependent dehydrogenase (short-subunit alcohol dehydrogenase family)
MVDLSVEEWDSVMASNLRSAFLTARMGHRLLRAAGGAIVNISSVHALATSRDIAAYAASKGGLVALTRALALELAPDSIRVNAVLPGAVDTPMLHAGLSRNHVAGDSVAARMADLGSRTVMGRVGKPEEIAQAILFLADGRRSSFVTGQTLVVDGGATARLSTEYQHRRRMPGMVHASVGRTHSCVLADLLPDLIAFRGTTPLRAGYPEEHRK